MNDAAAAGLGVSAGLGLTMPPEGLSEGLRAMAARGVELRGEAVVWKDEPMWPESAFTSAVELTRWERSASSFHLEDVVPVEVRLSADGEPSISDVDQLVLLRQGVGFALEVCRLVAEGLSAVAVRCVVSANSTNGTFRFHRLRPGEDWMSADLDSFAVEKIVLVEREPAPEPNARR